jgi:hypothetical protein
MVGQSERSHAASCIPTSENKPSTLVPSLPTCTAPSAYGLTSYVVPRAVFGICGLRDA